MASPELGFGFRSIGRLARRAVNVAALPVSAARRVANVASSALCRDGKSVSSDSRTQAFCKAVKMKDSVNVRRFLPSAVQQAAQRAATAQQMYAQARATAAQPLKGFEAAGDVDLLASLHGADSTDLAFALAGVEPGELGAFDTKELLAVTPVAIAVATGLWMLTRG